MTPSTMQQQQQQQQQRPPSDVLFCEECGNLLDLPGNHDDFMTCPLCNHTRQCSDFEKVNVVTRSRPNAFARQKVIYNTDQDDGHHGAIIDEECPKCQHPQMRFFTLQRRSADEGVSVFYTCLKCSYTYSLNS